MAAAPSPQPLAVGEANQNSIETVPNVKQKQSYAAQVQVNKSAAILSKNELLPVNFDHGEPVVEFTIEQVNEFIREEGMHQAVVVKFSYGKPDLQEVRRIFASQFDIQGNCNVGQLEFRHLLIRFDLFNDYVHFLSKSTGYLKSKGEEFFFRTFPWTLGFNPKEETSMAVVWISLPGLPPNFFARKSLLSIASAVGKPLAVDKATQDRTRPSAARVKVIIDLLDKHPKKVKLQIVDRATGKSVVIDQEIVYDNLPKYCTFCKHQAHDERTCRFVKEQAGEEMRAEDVTDVTLHVNDVVNGDKLKVNAREFLNARSSGQTGKAVSKNDGNQEIDAAKENQVAQEVMQTEEGKQDVHGKNMAVINQGVDGHVKVAGHITSKWKEVKDNRLQNKSKQHEGIVEGKQISDVNDVAVQQMKDRVETANKFAMLAIDNIVEKEAEDRIESSSTQVSQSGEKATDLHNGLFGEKAFTGCDKVGENVQDFDKMDVGHFGRLNEQQDAKENQNAHGRSLLSNVSSLEQSEATDAGHLVWSNTQHKAAEIETNYNVNVGSSNVKRKSSSGQKAAKSVVILMQSATNEAAGTHAITEKLAESEALNNGVQKAGGQRGHEDTAVSFPTFGNAEHSAVEAQKDAGPHVIENVAERGPSTLVNNKLDNGVQHLKENHYVSSSGKKRYTNTVQQPKGQLCVTEIAEKVEQKVSSRYDASATPLSIVENEATVDRADIKTSNSNGHLAIVEDGRTAASDGLPLGLAPSYDAQAHEQVNRATPATGDGTDADFGQPDRAASEAQFHVQIDPPTRVPGNRTSVGRASSSDAQADVQIDHNLVAEKVIKSKLWLQQHEEDDEEAKAWEAATNSLSWVKQREIDDQEDLGFDFVNDSSDDGNDGDICSGDEEMPSLVSPILEIGSIDKVGPGGKLNATAPVFIPSSRQQSTGPKGEREITTVCSNGPVSKSRNSLQKIEQHQSNALVTNTRGQSALITQESVQDAPQSVNVGIDLYEEGEEDAILQECRLEASRKGDLSPLHSGKSKKSQTRDRSWDGRQHNQDLALRIPPMRNAKQKASVPTTSARSKKK